MAKPHRVDEWGIARKVAEMWALGRRGRSILKDVRPDVEAWAKRTRQTVPNDDAIAMAITRYMKGNPGDRRMSRAKNQEAVAEIQTEAVREIVAAQVDAADVLRRYIRRIDDEVTRIESVMTTNSVTGEPQAPDFGEYYRALSSMSKEMRGWVTLLVDIRDKVWQHEQYEKAYAAILSAVRAECPPEIIERIAERLKQDPAVGAVLRGTGGG